MPWRYDFASHCRSCGKERDAEEVFSRRGRCGRCQVGNVARNVRGIHEHKGDEFLRWRRSVAKSVGAILIEDLESETEDGAL